MEYLSQILARNVRLIPERAFIVTERETLSYADFSARTAELAHILRARGIGRGDRVALYLPSTPLMAMATTICVTRSRPSHTILANARATSGLV